ncbi:MAG: ABC transporter permease, partial [Desulfobacterales bacterium]
MLKFLGRRLAASILIMAIASTVVFFSIHILPGDPVLILLGEQGASNPEVVARIRAQLNLDVSLPQQFWLWLKGLAVGDLGKSLENGLPVVEVISRRIPRSLEIIIAGLVLAATLGIPLGTIAARHRKRFHGTLASALAVVGFSSPVF